MAGVSPEEHVEVKETAVHLRILGVPAFIVTWRLERVIAEPSAIDPFVPDGNGVVCGTILGITHSS